MAHTTVWSEDGFYMKLFGTVDSKEITEINIENVSNPQIAEVSYFIWDSLGVDCVVVDEDDVSLSAMFSVSINSYLKNIKGAFVIVDEDIKLLISRYIEESIALGTTWNFSIFSNVEDAKKWVSKK